MESVSESNVSYSANAESVNDSIDTQLGFNIVSRCQCPYC